MNHLRFLFLLLIVGQTVLFAQKDSIKKSFKPYGLIDAAPVAINKEDFNPQTFLTIHAVDAISNLPVIAKFDYYNSGDNVVNTENGEVVSLTLNRHEKTSIIANAPGYVWQTQIFDNLESDSSYVLKFSRIKKGEIIKIPCIDFTTQDNKLNSNIHASLFGISEFLKLNSNVEIKLCACSKWKEEIHSFLIKNCDNKRLRFKSCRNQKQTDSGSITIKILSL